jgi:arabinofuranan 3-O-arabinosyltransferase
VTIRSWQPDQRRISIGPGAASYLEVHENYNSGWAAALNGQQLTPVRLDGWQQGFMVPAGAGGTITLTFRPAGTYHVVLVASILAAILLLAVAAWSGVGPMGVTPYRFLPVESDIQAVGGGFGGTQAVGRGFGGTQAVGGGSGGEQQGRSRGWLGLFAVAALIFVAGGAVALVVPMLAWLAWRPARSSGGRAPAEWLPVVAAAGLVASGLLSAVRPFGGSLFGPFGWPAQACALVALAAALMPAAGPVWRRHRPGASAPGPEEEDG